MRPRILLCTQGNPYPYHQSGGYRIVAPVLEELSSEWDIDLLFPVHDEEEENEERMAPLRARCRRVWTFSHRNRPIRRAAGAFLHRLPSVFHRYPARAFRRGILARLKPHLEGFDLLLVQDTHLVPFVDDLTMGGNIGSVLAIGDYLTLVFERLKETTRHPLHRLYYAVTASKLRRCECDVYRLFDRIVYVSGVDRQQIERRCPELASHIQVIPNAVDESLFDITAPPASPPTIAFTGNMRYEPNRQAVEWFFENVWHSLKEQCHDLVWDVVGMHAEEQIQLDHPSVKIYGSVPSLEPFIRRASVVISPLQSGAGLKNKVLEGMAAGRVVVGTSLSFDGIPIQDGIHAIIAESPEEYVSDITSLLAREGRRRRIQREARELIRRYFDIETVTNRWRSLVEGDQAVTGEETSSSH